MCKIVFCTSLGTDQVLSSCWVVSPVLRLRLSVNVLTYIFSQPILSLANRRVDGDVYLLLVRPVTPAVALIVPNERVRPADWTRRQLVRSLRSRCVLPSRCVHTYTIGLCELRSVYKFTTSLPHELPTIRMLSIRCRKELLYDCTILVRFSNGNHRKLVVGAFWCCQTRI